MNCLKHAIFYDAHISCPLCLQEAANKLARRRWRTLVWLRVAVALFAAAIMGGMIWWDRPQMLTFDETRWSVKCDDGQGGVFIGNAIKLQGCDVEPIAPPR